MNVDEFLRLKGAELPDVIAQVDTVVGLGAGEILLAVGSLAEGIGTSKSDLDLLLITPQPDSRFSSSDDIPLLVGRCLIDLRILPLAELEELLGRFEAWSRSPRNLTLPVQFTLDERTFLHRLLHARVLYRGKRERVTARLPPRLNVARLKLQVARHAARTIQVDMAGYRGADDYRSLVFAAQEVLGHGVDALLAGYELTNPLAKWRSRMLDAVPAGWERLLAVRPSGLTAGERVWRLHRVPELPDKKSALEYAFRITTFVRAVFMWAESHLMNRSSARQKPAVWPRVERASHDAPLPYLDFDVDFLLGAGQVAVARLNEFDEPLVMSPQEFALTLLFDGTTTAREAEVFVYGSRRGKASAGAIDRVLVQVARASLSVPPDFERGTV